MCPRRVWSVLVPLALLVAACGDDTGAATTTTSATSDGLDGTITVLAAASLAGAFEEIATAFEDAHPGVDVELTFDGSSKLATAIIEGAPGDVFASADTVNLERAADAARTTGRRANFATNALQIVVPEGNPLGVQALRDLAAPGIALALCGAEVPCGAYARQAFEQAGLAVPPAGDQESVTGVLTQVQLGEADAGIVYVTDVLAADDVAGIDLAPDQRVVATYPATPLADSSNLAAAETFVRFLTDELAQGILRDFGFGPP
jgi:molybdate transport system substrate-binding protein